MAMSTVRIPTPQRRWPVILIGAVVVFAVVFTVMSTFYVDLLWFREVGLTSVFWTELRTKVALGMVFGMLFFALLYVNLLVTRRLAPPPVRFLTPEQEAVERIRMAVEPFLAWLLPLGALALALLVGIGVSRQWQVFLLWRNSSDVVFGDLDPLFDRDPGFYIFSLPWMKFLQGWLFSSLVGVTFLTAIAHFFWGGIRPQARTWGDRVLPATRAHLSVLLGLIMLSKAWGYYLGRFDLLTSRRGVVQGASYTDINAQLPALNFLIIAAVICAALFFANIVRQRWALPIIAVIVLAAVSVLLGTAYPAFVQRFRVAPQEFQREEEYIGDNLEATRRAFGIDDIDLPQDRTYEPTVLASDIEPNATTIENIRLWRPAVLNENFQSLQRIRSYYEFRDVDVDRYELDGEQRVLMVSGREVSQAGIEGQTWQNEHLVFTHGFGAVAAKVNTQNSEGAPVLVLADVPTRAIGDAPELTEPRIYFGEGDPTDAQFVIARSGTPELDYDGAPPGYEYTGSGGIEIGNAVQRALFAWRFRDVNLLISGQINDRQPHHDLPRPRVAGAEARAVPVVRPRSVPRDRRGRTHMDLGRVHDDERVSLLGVHQPAGRDREPRSAVGARELHAELGQGDGRRLRRHDEVLRGLERSDHRGVGSRVPGPVHADRRGPCRTPLALPVPGEPLPGAGDAVRHLPRDRSGGLLPEAGPLGDRRRPDSADAPELGTTTASSLAAAPRLRPYYLLMRAPGERSEQFQLVLPFIPEGRQNMVAWLAASSDPETYGRLLSLELPAEENVPGPSIVFSRINQDQQFSAERTLLGQGGSAVLFGDLLVIPIENSFLYVQPVYVKANQSASVPELKRVVVVNGDAVAVGGTLEDALAGAVEGQTEPDGGGGGPDGGGVDRTVAELLAEAADHFEAADAALRAGDLATYELEVEAAQDLVAQALELSGATPPVESSTSPSPAA